MSKFSSSNFFQSWRGWVLKNKISSIRVIQSMPVVIMIAALSICLSDVAYSQLLEQDPKVLATLEDKTGSKYQITRKYTLSQGLASFEYKYGAKGKLKKLYEGKTFGDGEQCPPEQFKKNVSINSAVLKQEILKKDLNADMIDDFSLSIIERDCSTGELVFLEKLILSSDVGFQLKEITYSGDGK